MPLTHRVDNHSQACTFQKRMASSQKDMEPQGRESGAPVRTRRRSGTLGLRKTTLESRVHVQTVGLNAKKIISALSQGKTFLLTFPFIGSLRAACCVTDCSLSLVRPPYHNQRKLPSRTISTCRARTSYWSDDGIAPGDQAENERSHRGLSRPSFQRSHTAVFWRRTREGYFP